MQWLIDALREPAAQLVQLVGTLALAALAARLRGNVQRLGVQVEEVKQSGSSSSTPPTPASLDPELPLR